MDVTEAKRDAAGRPRSWQGRKEGYVAHLQTAPPPSAAISLADKLHNLWTINEGLRRGLDVFTSQDGRRGLSAGPERQRWFHRAVLDATRHHADVRLDALRERLAEEVERFERLTGQEEGRRVGRKVGRRVRTGTTACTCVHVPSYPLPLVPS